MIILPYLTGENKLGVFVYLLAPYFRGQYYTIPPDFPLTGNWQIFVGISNFCLPLEDVLDVRVSFYHDIKTNDKYLFVILGVL